MLRRQIMIVVVGVVVGGALAAGCASGARSTEQEIAVDQVPPAVMQSFQRDGTVEYELEFQDRDGTARDVEYSAAGAQLNDDDDD